MFYIKASIKYILALSIKVLSIANLNLAWLLWQGQSRAKRSYPMSKVRGSGREEQTHVQGKVRQLQFAGAAVKRYSTFKVIETQVRW